MLKLLDSPDVAIPNKGGLMNSICYEIQAALPNPNVFNLNKNSLGTNGFGLTKFDCIQNAYVHACILFFFLSLMDSVDQLLVP